MSVQYRFFSIPVNNEAEAEEELNGVLRAAQAVVVHRELICQDDRFYWAIAVECAVGTGKGRARGEMPEKRIDYKEVLSAEDFAVYAKLREWRKETATREGVQLFNVFRNDQMAAMVQQRVTGKNKLLEIDGVGRARVDKYGDAVLAILHKAFAEMGGTDEAGN